MPGLVQETQIMGKFYLYATPGRTLVREGQSPAPAGGVQTPGASGLTRRR